MNAHLQLLDFYAPLKTFSTKKNKIIMTYIRVFHAFITISRKKDKNIFTKMITSSGHQSYIRHHSRTSELNQRAIPCTIATKKKKHFSQSFSAAG